MNESKNLDLSTLSFDEFVEFFFQRPENEEFWYFEPMYQRADSRASRPEILISHLTRLFTEFAVIAKRYSIAQIDHGIWALFPSSSVSVTEYLWDRSITLEKRLQCIRAMLHIYSDFVAISDAEVMENCFDMWWDMLADDFWSHTGQLKDRDVSKLDPESRMLLDAMFDTLETILELPDLRTQKYALHGLGHLHHPGVRPLVQKFIDTNSNTLSEHGLRWVEQCRDGTVM